MLEKGAKHFRAESIWIFRFRMRLWEAWTVYVIRSLLGIYEGVRAGLTQELWASFTGRGWGASWKGGSVGMYAAGTGTMHH